MTLSTELCASRMSKQTPDPSKITRDRPPGSSRPLKGWATRPAPAAPRREGPADIPLLLLLVVDKSQQEIYLLYPGDGGGEYRTRVSGVQAPRCYHLHHAPSSSSGPHVRRVRKQSQAQTDPRSTKCCCPRANCLSLVVGFRAAAAYVLRNANTSRSDRPTTKAACATRASHS